MIEESKLHIGKHVWFINGEDDWDEILEGEISAIETVDQFNNYKYYYVNIKYGEVANFYTALYEKESEAIMEVYNQKEKEFTNIKKELKSLRKRFEVAIDREMEGK